MTEITIDEVENENKADIAALRCRSYTFQGKPLHPVTKLRALSATLLGIVGFSRSIPLLPDGTVDSGPFHDDLMRFIWLLNVNESVARSAPLNRQKAFEQAFDWWAENCDEGEGPFLEAYEVWKSVCEDRAAVDVEVDSSGTGPANSGLGE